MIQNAPYMQLRSHVYSLQSRHIKTDPLKCGKNRHRMLSTVQLMNTSTYDNSGHVNHQN